MTFPVCRSPARSVTESRVTPSWPPRLKGTRLVPSVSYLRGTEWKVHLPYSLKSAPLCPTRAMVNHSGYLAQGGLLWVASGRHPSPWQGGHSINSAGGLEPLLSACLCALCFSLSCRGSRWVPASWPPWSNTTEKGESSGGSKIRVPGFSVIRYPGSRAQASINCCGPRIGLPGLGQMLILNCGVQGGWGPSQPNHTDWERRGAGLQRKSG